MLEEGRIVEQGPAADVLSRPRSAFAARIAGLNMLVGTWRGDGVHTSTGIDVHGLVTGPAPTDGEPAVAVFPPTAVAVFRQPPGGSPRNALSAVVTELEPHGDRIRVRAGDLSADVTAQAVAELDLASGLGGDLQREGERGVGLPHLGRRPLTAPGRGPGPRARTA